MRTIAHISDLHFGCLDAPVAEGLVHELHAMAPNLVVVSGDFTQRARERQYQDAAAYLKRLPTPQLVIPGNHDIPLYDVIRRFFFPLHRYRRLISPDLRPSYQDEEMLVVGVNSARPFSLTWDGFWKDGRISEEQLLDIKLRACDAPDEVMKIVVTHHPFVPPPGERKKGIIRGAARALATMQDCRIDLLLAGHLHQGYSDDVRTHHEAVRLSILSVQAGTATSTRRRNEPNAYNQITVDGSAVTVQVRKWEADRFIDGARRRFVKTQDVWIEDKP